MASETRTARDPLTLLRDIAAAPHGFGFYHALRLLECAHPDAPRFGTSKRLQDDPLRLGQAPSLAFAPTTLHALELREGERPPRLIEYFFGLFGANGALPHFLTEYARDRQRNLGDATTVRFFDLFHHRLLTQFYRAWAEAQPTVSLDRPGEDAFGRHLAALCGYGMASLAARDAVPDYAKRAHAGLLARQSRNAEGLATILRNFFGVIVRVEQSRPHWVALQRTEQTALTRGASNAQLGVTSVAGERVWDCQSRFRVVLGPLTLPDYERFLPGRSSYQRLAVWIRNYLGDEFSWELQLVLARRQVPLSWLGNATLLGWTSWLGVRNSPHDADELVLNCTP